MLILDRPRHEHLVADVREAGARIRLISDGDVAGAIETAKPTAPVDIMLGIGGALSLVALYSACNTAWGTPRGPKPAQEWEQTQQNVNGGWQLRWRVSQSDMMALTPHCGVSCDGLFSVVMLACTVLTAV